MKEVILKDSEGVKYIIYESFNNYKITTLNNYNNYIMDANKVKTFYKKYGFESLEDVISYCKTYLNLK